MLRTLIVVVLLLPLVPAPASAQQPTSSPFYEKCAMADPPEPAPKSCESPARPTCAQLYSQAAHASYARAVYRRDEVTRAAQRRVGHMRACQHSYTARVNARRLTRRLRGRYRDRKRPKLAGLPACTWVPESGGDYGALNPSSGAYGKYQVIPSTWAAHCSDLDRGPAGQERCAVRIWNAQGPGAWVNC